MFPNGGLVPQNMQNRVNREKFLKKVYLILCLQVVATLTIMMITDVQHPTSLLMVVLAMVGSLKLNLLFRHVSPVNKILLVILTASTGQIVGVIILPFSDYEKILAVCMTGIVVVIMTIVAFETWPIIRLTESAPFVIMGLCAFAIYDSNTYLHNAQIGVTVLSIALCSYTHFIIEINLDEFIFACTGLYGIIIMIFLHIMLLWKN